IVRLVRQYRVGGFCLFGGSTKEVERAVLDLQAEANGSLLFSADCEFGLPMRFRSMASNDSGTEFPDPMAIAKTGDPSLAFETGRAIAREMRAVGIHWNFAPVMDVNSNPENPIINTRAFGDDPETVSSYGTEFLRGVQAESVAATAKHFPGHGDTAVDSHRELPVLERNWEEFQKIELPPFERAIEAGVQAIMTGHLAAPLLAAYLGASSQEAALPATLSRVLTETLLRERMHFDGVIVTDALEMQAITKHLGREEALVLAFEAGADILLMPPEAEEACGALRSAFTNGRISEHELDRKLARIRKLKSFSAIDPGSVDVRKLEALAGPHSELAEEIAKQAMEIAGHPSAAGANMVVLCEDRPEPKRKAASFAERMFPSVPFTTLSTSEWPAQRIELDPQTIVVIFHRVRGYVATPTTE